MLKPGIGQLLNESDSVYSLVVAIARRSRDISAEAQERHEKLADKAVNIAIDEFAEHRLRVVNGGRGTDAAGEVGAHDETVGLPAKETENDGPSDETASFGGTAAE